MRRIAMILMLLVSTVVLSGCLSQTFQDPLHPRAPTPLDYEP